MSGSDAAARMTDGFHGDFASMTLRSPPRAANSPMNLGHTGWQAFTTSDRDEWLRRSGTNDGWVSRVFRLNDTSKSATGGKLTDDLGPYRVAGFYDVMQNAVDSVFVENAEISVCMKIH